MNTEKESMAQPFRNKHVYRGITLLGMILTVICALIIVGMLWPYQYFTATSPTVNSNQYSVGGPAVLHYEKFCTNVAEDILVQRSSINMETGRQLFLLPYKYKANTVTTGCIENLNIEIPLPSEMVAGDKYRLQTTITYKPNPVRTVSQTFTSNVFTVTDKEPNE